MVPYELFLILSCPVCVVVTCKGPGWGAELGWTPIEHEGKVQVPLSPVGVLEQAVGSSGAAAALTESYGNTSEGLERTGQLYPGEPRHPTAPCNPWRRLGLLSVPGTAPAAWLELSRGTKRHRAPRRKHKMTANIRKWEYRKIIDRAPYYIIDF